MLRFTLRTLTLTSVFALGLTTLGGCKPKADGAGAEGDDGEKGEEGEEVDGASTGATLPAGASRISFETPHSNGPKTMTLLAGGDVLVGEEKVGTYADGKLVVDGVHVGQLEADGEFRLGGFDDAVFRVDEDGVMAKEGAEGGYVAYAEDGTMQGGVVEETAGMKGKIEGDPGLRREMTFLFMALTVARGPAISDAASSNNAVVLDGDTGSEEAADSDAAADDTGGGESANVE